MQFRFRGAVLCAILLSAPVSSALADPPEFPVVFTSPSELVPFGILIRPVGDTTPVPPDFNTKCYEGTDLLPGEPELFVSDKLMANHRAKGFTPETLCMGLASGTKFDPETGQRLPTYILRDQQTIVRGLEEQLAEARGGGSIPVFDTVEEFAAAVDAIKQEEFTRVDQEKLELLLDPDRGLTLERPFVVPPCYKNATPYLDCNWKFGAIKGAPYPNSLKQWASTFSKALDKQMKDAIASGKPLAFTDSTSEIAVAKQDLLNGLYDGQPDAVKVPANILEKDNSIDWIIISKALPRGYGYAFYAQRFPDGVFSVNSIDPQKSSKKLEPEGLLDKILSFF
ncbi:hypothetical protein [Hyphomicrobium sp.]|uniref:hypothetical protein n=1 Tax=Hyphomicrobium sp. TaxID=82 RepID=UPI0025C223EE|nr:hypothetical protein [Hyphomicrobium sp.]MCC7252845.1 hypothetical protein [Hyphomicrobium sp.]